MRAFVHFVFVITLLVSTVAAGLSSGSLPGCRFVVRPTPKWQIASTSGNLPDSSFTNSVCAAVGGASVWEFTTNEQIWVLDKVSSNRDRVTCNKVDYCTSSDYQIVRCADLGCARAGFDEPNYCSATDMSQNTCVVDSDSVTVSEFLDDLSDKWDALIEGFKSFLNKFALGVGIDFAKKLWALKQPVIDALELRLAGYPQISKVVLKRIFKEIVEQIVVKTIPKVIIGIVAAPVSVIAVFVDIVWNDVVIAH